MEDLTPKGHHDEEYYVAKMNHRYEKHLKKQIKRLNKEKELRAKSMELDQKPYEEKMRRLSTRVVEIAQLTKDTSDSSSASGIHCNEDSLLKDLTRKPLTTGAGYSYVQYLMKNAEPLVKRPLQWGINPPLSNLRHSNSPLSALTTKTNGMNSKTLIPHVKGNSLPLKQKYDDSVFEKDRKLLHLPPIRTNVRVNKKKQSPGSVSGYHWKPKDSVGVERIRDPPTVSGSPKRSLQVTPEKHINIRESKEKMVSHSETEESTKESVEYSEEIPGVSGGNEEGKKQKNAATADEVSGSNVDETILKPGVFVTEFNWPSYGLADLRRSSDVLDLAVRGERDRSMIASSFNYKVHQRPRRYSF